MAHNLRKLVIKIEEMFETYRATSARGTKLTKKGQISWEIQEARRMISDIQTRGGGIPEKFDDMISTSEIKEINTKLNSIENSLKKDREIEE
ncbi:hypothetical protein HOE39_00640 [Candidatus Woesearchaeota archaeon]|jgi:hypothetical protein|nr:hypothetical protein [Candidatus Woesearchaeota archaeon]